MSLTCCLPGTGILALPVKLVTCGFWPFVFIFTIGLVMQIAGVFLMTEILQVAKCKMRDDASLRFKDNVDDVGLTDYQPVSDHTSESNESTVNAQVANAVAHVSPDLHTLGRMYLSRGARIAFDVVVILHFAFILLSYAVAGSLSFEQLTAVPYRVCLTPFAGVLTLVVVFGSRVLSPWIAAMTATKTVLLLSVIVAVGALSSDIDVGPTSQWSSVLAPFLLSTVALGGTVCLMPVLFTRVPFNPTSIRRFRTAVSSGITACYSINIAWCYFILRIVPQTDADAALLSDDELRAFSLEYAARKQLTSAMVLVDIIGVRFPTFEWVSSVIAAFVTISISISYLTMSLGLKHVLDGVYPVVIRCFSTRVACVCVYVIPPPVMC